MSGEITSQWGLLAIVIPAILAAVVAIIKIFKGKQNGNGKSTSKKVAIVEKALSELDPKVSGDAAIIKQLQGEILVIKAEDTERVKAKTLEMGQIITTLQTQLKTAEVTIGDIKEDLENLIIETGRDRAQILALDKNVAIMNALNEYEDKKRKKGGNGGPPISSN